MGRSAETLFGRSPVPPPPLPPDGRFEGSGDEAVYVIDRAEGMRPFLVSVVGNSDHWLYVTSNGAVTAGRRNPGIALFPYVTEDKLVDSAGKTGPVTTLRVARRGRTFLWHPFRDADRLAYAVTRRLRKDLLGTRFALEEENLDLGVSFRQEWSTSDRFGFVRTSTVENRERTPVGIQVLDGLLDLLPANVDEALQRGFSCLLDAYKQAELVPGTSLALYFLAATPVDRAEPSESLRAATVWSRGLPGARVHLTADRIASFDAGRPARAETEARGRRGAYLLEGRLTLPGGKARSWTTVADVDRSQAQVVELRGRMARPARLLADLESDVVEGRRALLRTVAAADALQVTGDRVSSAHHLGNVLFNVLRGGVPLKGYDLPGPDLAAFVRRANRDVARRHEPLLEGLAAVEPRAALADRVSALGDPDLERLVLEYLPFTFSRRHGDPSRPWNRFDIRVRDRDGRQVLHYEGNWRDIFQNWEALLRSFPDFAEHVIAKFVNASTPDGHNPYRITRDGIDWESPDPDHPWSTIGYWGDHQVVYLLRLLELAHDHHPDRLRGLLEKAIFSYADVPYEIAPFEALLGDPRSTIRFDAEKDRRLRTRAAELGSDGKLLQRDGAVVRVGLVEKLLVPALARLANLVAGSGIWLNTQRPEWNDANNALVGYGVSTVTLCHLQRYLAFLPRLLEPLRGGTVPLSAEVRDWMEGTAAALDAHREILAARAVTDRDRGSLLRALGEAASTYRGTVYRTGLGAPVPVAVDDLLALAATARAFVSHSIAAARRADGLFHAYDVLVPRPDGSIGLEHLPEMLEGQVAVLSAGVLGPAHSSKLLGVLARSRMYRPDQDSYLLYPDRRLPRFLEKGRIPPQEARALPLLARLAGQGDPPVVERDGSGTLRFGPSLANAERCREALRALRESGTPGLDDGAVEQVLEVYERVFHHRAFTGRSGTMFAYEGLGSIYWHMVGKLLVATQEAVEDADEAGAGAAVVRRLADRYHAVRAGLVGLEKSPAVYGAFPLDPYSHTPAHAGAQQPGMTGEVKEEILTRAGELGVRIRGGRIRFRPLLLRRREFLSAPATFEPWDVAGRRLSIPLPTGSLAFTLCQVPVVYRLGKAPRITVVGSDGVLSRQDGDTLDEATSASIFGREGRVTRVEVETRPGR